VNQIVAVLKATLTGLLTVLFVWHLFQISKRLGTGGSGRQIRRRGSEPHKDWFRNVPIDPR